MNKMYTNLRLINYNKKYKLIVSPALGKYEYIYTFNVCICVCVFI